MKIGDRFSIYNERIYVIIFRIILNNITGSLFFYRVVIWEIALSIVVGAYEIIKVESIR